MAAVTMNEIVIQPVGSDNVWRWLNCGWSDLLSRPLLSLCYGAVVTLLSYIVLACLIFFDLVYLLLPLATGFMFGGPVIAVGLYEMSRRYGDGTHFRLSDLAGAFRRSPLQLAYMGLILVLFALLWIRIATLLFALFFGSQTPPLSELFSSLFLTFQGTAFLAVGTLVGAVLAFGAYAISVVSLPLIVDKEVDVMTAVITSLKAVRVNFLPMMLWAWLVALFTASGIITLFVGLIVVFPLVGHATWHCYRDILGYESANPAQE